MKTRSIQIGSFALFDTLVKLKVFTLTWSQMIVFYGDRGA